MDYYYYGYANPYGYGYDGTMQILSRLIGPSVWLLFILSVYIIVAYCLRSAGLYHMAKQRGIAHAWFSWIPFLSYYIVGRLDNDKVVFGDNLVLPHAEFFLPFFTFLAFCNSVEEGLLVGLISAAVWVYKMSGYYRLYQIYKPKSRFAYTIWSALIGSGFFIFSIRNDRPFDPLEPDKVYQNYYGRKATITDHYDPIIKDLNKQEDSELKDLKDSYDQSLEKEGLSADQKETLKKDYNEDRNTIVEEYNTKIDREKDEEVFRLNQLNDSIKEAAYPDTVNRPEQLNNTDTTVSPAEKFPEEGMSVISAKEISAPLEQLDITGPVQGQEELEIEAPEEMLEITGTEPLEISAPHLSAREQIDHFKITDPEEVKGMVGLEELIESFSSSQNTPKMETSEEDHSSHVSTSYSDSDHPAE